MTGTLRCLRWLLVTLTALVIGLGSMCSTAHGQTTGASINTCSNYTLDQSNGIVQTVCASGNKNELDFYSEVDDLDYNIQYSSGPCLPMVYTQVTVSDSLGTTVLDSGLQSGASSASASGSILPKLNENYVMMGAAYAAVTPDYSGGCNAIDEYGQGLSVRVTAPSPQGTTATLTASPNPALVGTTVQFVVQVSPSAATGSVSIYDAGNLVGSSYLVSGSATISTASLAVGLHSIAASYSGDSVYASTTSAPTSLTITPLVSTPSASAPCAAGSIYCFNITDQNGNSGYAANGNITAYSDSVNGTWALSYDSLNRLTGSSQTPISGNSRWGCWAYDGSGNILTQGISSQTFANAATCQAQPSATTLQSSLTYNSANQILSGTWLDVNNNSHTGSPLYDASGQVTSDLLNNYLYDAQGQLCAVQTGASSYIGYLYDAEGHRVAKGSLQSLTCDSTNLQITATYFIGPDGTTMTEIDGSGNWVRTEVSGAAGQHLVTYTPNGMHLPVTDWLGTKRLSVNTTLGVIEERCSSFPFGDQLNCNTTIDPSPEHFTGKERDVESGLDNFVARYYASSVFRFMSPDWSAKEDPVPYAKLEDPQSLNLYSYVLNNPLSNVDTDGHICIALVNRGGGFCTRAKEYDKIDSEPAIRAKTRFFGAASLVSTALGDVALPGRKRMFSDSTAGFLETIGETLKPFNEDTSNKIKSGTMGGSELDKTLVTLEQTIVQSQLDKFRNADPGLYQEAITEINRALNSTGTSVLGLALDMRYTAVLLQLKRSLGGRDLDFSNQKDREAIGNALIKALRQGFYTQFTGMCPAQYANCK